MVICYSSPRKHIQLLIVNFCDFIHEWFLFFWPWKHIWLTCEQAKYPWKLPSNSGKIIPYPPLRLGSQVWSLFGSFPSGTILFILWRVLRDRGLGACRYNCSLYWLGRTYSCFQSLPDCHNLKNQVPSIPELSWGSSVQSDSWVNGHLPYLRICLLFSYVVVWELYI